MSNQKTRALLLGVTGLALGASGSLASDIYITIENLQSQGGFSFSPFWLGAHDGSFDMFDVGVAASGGIAELAELADPSVLGARFASEQPMGMGGVFAEPGGSGHPTFNPGESASMLFDVGDNRYFSYASMVVPSNDLFVGNDNAIELFDAGGNFLGPVVIEIYGASVWDAGSEVNDKTNGAAFIMGSDAMAGADEGGVVHALFSDADAGTYLSSFIGETTPVGDLTQAFDRTTLLGRITIVPTPGVLAGLLPLGLGAAARRRR